MIHAAGMQPIRAGDDAVRKIKEHLAVIAGPQ